MDPLLRAFTDLAVRMRNVIPILRGELDCKAEAKVIKRFQMSE